MKKLTPLTLLLLFSLQCFAQNWQCVPRNTHPYYSNSYGYLRSMRVDSVKVKGVDTILYPYRSLRGNYLDSYPKTLDSNGGSWMGKTVTIKPDGTHYFEGYWGDTVIIKTNASLGDGWTLYNDTTGWHYDATITSLDTMNISGTNDSIKTIQLKAYNKTGINTVDPLNNATIILSKNFGLVQTPDLYMFPLHKPDTAYSKGFDYFTDTTGPDFIFKRIELQNPLFSDLYDFNIGDTYISTDQIDYSFPITNYIDITGKSIVNGIITYTQNVTTYNPYKGTSKGSGTFTVPQGKLFDTTYMPEEYGASAFYFYHNDSDMCVRGTYRLVCNNINGTIVNTFEPGICNIKYKLTFGKFYEFTQDGSGAGTQETMQLIRFYIHGNPCSLSVGTMNKNNGFNIYPNPASDEIQIQLRTNDNYSLQMYNAVGQLVKSKAVTTNKTSITVSDLPNGVYYISAITETGENIHKQIIVTH